MKKISRLSFILGLVGGLICLIIGAIQYFACFSMQHELIVAIFAMCASVIGGIVAIISSSLTRVIPLISAILKTVAAVLFLIMVVALPLIVTIDTRVSFELAFSFYPFYAVGFVLLTFASILGYISVFKKFPEENK